MPEKVLFAILIGIVGLSLPPIRRNLLTRPLFNKMRKALPQMSQTTQMKNNNYLSLLFLRSSRPLRRMLIIF